MVSKAYFQASSVSSPDATKGAHTSRDAPEPPQSRPGSRAAQRRPRPPRGLPGRPNVSQVAQLPPRSPEGVPGGPEASYAVRRRPRPLRKLPRSPNGSPRPPGGPRPHRGLKEVIRKRQEQTESWGDAKSVIKKTKTKKLPDKTELRKQKKKATSGSAIKG